jgi:molybdate/tungstate transport system ATP-binding protein
MIELKNINYRVGSFLIENFSLAINSGEYFSLVGPSGSGKSIILELLAGFRSPNSGQIFHNSQDITQVSIQKRPFRIVFQDFALFPHLNVFENIEYGIKQIEKSKVEKANLITTTAQQMGIGHLLDRSVNHLSGGEKQRVALARSIICKPDVLLFDEPLSSLDVNLRDDFLEIFQQLKKSGFTILHVTHDFEEAAQLSHRIGIIENGNLIQVGEPIDFYKNPKHPFVAKFAGHKNIFKANLIKNDIGVFAQIFESEVNIFIQESRTGEFHIFIPSEAILISDVEVRSSAQNVLQGTISEFSIFGESVQLKIDVGVPIVAKISNASFQNLKLEIGKKVYVVFKSSSVGVI